MIKIHLVEDDADAMEMIMRRLNSDFQSSSIEILSYYDFNGFFSNLENKNVDDIYVLDFLLGPNQNGLDIYKKLQQKIKYPKTIFLSAFANLENEIRTLRRNPERENVKFISKSHFWNETDGILSKEIRSLIDQDSEEGYSNLLIASNLLIVKNDIKVINQNLLEVLARNPNAIYELNPRRFEELVAELFEFEGYQVELTPSSNDGGKDIYAYKKDFFNEYLFAVECKKFSPENKVGRPVVNKLNGVVEHERLTGGILVTSSYYTEPAKQFSSELKNRIFLNDYNDLMKLIGKYGGKTDYNK